tara:strand:- start:2586 stop:4277 length:1692 start_codon:yes stop_codon:yes gene_type:complete
MSVFTVVYPFHYTVTADTFNNAIKHFVKAHRDMNINHLIIKDQERHMEARVKKFWKDGRNFLGLNVYPVENPFTGQIQYVGDNPMRGGADDEDDLDDIEGFEDLDLDDEKEMTGGMMSMAPYSGFMGPAAIPAVSYNQPTVGLSPVIGGIAPPGVTQLTTTPPLSPTVNLGTFAQTGTNVAATAAGTSVVSPTFSQVQPGTRVLSPIVGPMLSPGMGGLGPMITTKNRFQGAPITPSTSLFPTYDQTGKRHMTVAMSPTKSVIAPAGGTTIATKGGMPFVGGIPGTSMMAPMGGFIAPMGLAATSLSNPGSVNVTGQVNLTPQASAPGTPGAAPGTPGTPGATGAPGTPSAPGTPATGTPATGTPATGTATTPSGTYNFTATINLNPLIPGLSIPLVNPPQPQMTIDLKGNLIDQILKIMVTTLAQERTQYVGKPTALAAIGNIEGYVNNIVSNPPTTNNVTSAQQLINSIKSSVDNEKLGAATPTDVTAVTTQLDNILTQLQNAIQSVPNTQVPLANQGNVYNPGTAAYAGSVAPYGLPTYGVPFGFMQKNSWSPKITKKDN